MATIHINGKRVVFILFEDGTHIRDMEVKSSSLMAMLSQVLTKALVSRAK